METGVCGLAVRSEGAAAGADGSCEELPPSSPGPPEASMLLLRPAALCLLCSGEFFQPIRTRRAQVRSTNTCLSTSTGLVVIETRMTQKISVTSRAGQRVSISCEGTDRCGTYVIWYQKKNQGTFERILLVDLSDSEVSYYSHPDKDDFRAELQENTCNLIIQSAKLSHSAWYYCTCVTQVHSDRRSELPQQKPAPPDVARLWISISADLKVQTLEPCLGAATFSEAPWDSSQLSWNISSRMATWPQLKAPAADFVLCCFTVGFGVWIWDQADRLR